MGKNMNKVQTCGSKRIPCLRMKQGHTHTHTHQCAHTHTHISAHAHMCRCKRCCCCCKVASVVSDSVRPHRQQPARLPIPGILQARTLEWVVISFSNAGNWKVKVNSLSHVWLLATPWTAAHQAPPPMGFSRQEYWSGVPLQKMKRR